MVNIQKTNSKVYQHHGMKSIVSRRRRNTFPRGRYYTCGAYYAKFQFTAKKR